MKNHMQYWQVRSLVACIIHCVVFLPGKSSHFIQVLIMLKSKQNFSLQTYLLISLYLLFMWKVILAHCYEAYEDFVLLVLLQLWGISEEELQNTSFHSQILKQEGITQRNNASNKQVFYCGQGLDFRIWLKNAVTMSARLVDGLRSWGERHLKGLPRRSRVEFILSLGSFSCLERGQRQSKVYPASLSNL